jgi:SEL1 protein
LLLSAGSRLVKTIWRSFLTKVRSARWSLPEGVVYIGPDKSMFRRTSFANFFPSNDTARLALTQWTRSAAQNNVDALVKVGDYYYHGLGVPDEPENVRWEKAAGYYQSAADTQVSALAMWNLGWMYEHGYGVLQVRFS